MARCGALRGVARLGQVVASWESLIIFKVPIVRVGHAKRVRWVALWYEFGWLLLHVIRAVFSSHQCCTLAGPISGAPMLCTRSKVSRTVLSWSECRYAAMLFFQAQEIDGLFPGQARSLPGL